MKDVVFYEVFKEEKEALKKYLPPDIAADFFAGTIQEAKTKKLLSALLSIRTQSDIPVSWGKDLKGVLARSSGFDQLLAYKKKSKTCAALGYLPRYCARAVAEQAILMALSLFRKLFLQRQKMSDFNRDGMTGRECQGKNILVVGVGNIGAEAVDIGRGLKMHVKGVDIAPKMPGVEYVSLQEGLAWADAIICALPLTTKTKGMLNYAALESVKPGALFVNVARGEISPLNDLKRLLDEDRLGGIGLDVYEDEGALAVSLREKDKTNPFVKIINELKKKDNVIFTPHNAFNTRESLDRKAKQSVEAVRMFLEKGSFPNPVVQSEAS